jgi:TetR/AcrR family hemagglutinin/protease transcriptional regulator
LLHRVYTFEVMPILDRKRRAVTMDAAYARTRLPPEERRAQLLRHALIAFAEYGIARATHSHVAARAGVSVSAVHSYFRTREDLVSATLGEVEAYLDDLIIRTLGVNTVPVYDTLMSLADVFARDGREKPDMVKVWLDWSTGVGSDVWPRYLEALDRLHEAAQKVFIRGKREKLLPETLNVKAAARIYIGGGHTVALMQFAGASRSDTDRLNDQLVRNVMGIGMNAPVRGGT